MHASLMLLRDESCSRRQVMMPYAAAGHGKYRIDVWVGAESSATAQGDHPCVRGKGAALDLTHKLG